MRDEEQFDLKGGVLIIGSLLWQEHLDNKRKDCIRKEWRDRYLSMREKMMVKVPIRYGRLSDSGIYTMTFSNSTNRLRLGTGYFVPFQRNSYTSVKEIFQEGDNVSKAEGMKGRYLAQRTNNDVWCILSILFNSKVKLQIRRKIITEWKTKLESEGVFAPSDFKIGREKPCVLSNGSLNIRWPIAVDKRSQDILNGFDFLIATATKPTEYPNIVELAKKVNTDKERYYFIENYKAGITTFQDFDVLNRLG